MKLGWNGSSSGKSSETKRPASSVFGREADDDEGEEDGSKRTKVQLISGLAGSQFVGLGPDHAATTPVGPLVIPMIEQNEWRATDRLPGRVKVNSAVAEIVKEGASLSRKPTGPASDVLGFEKTEIVTPSLGDTGKQWGLQISSRKEASAAMASSKSSVEVAPIQDPMEGIVTEAPKSLEDQAMDRLMAEARGEVDVSKDTVGPRVLPILVQNTVPGLEDLKSEAEKFKHDVNMRPDVSSLDDYERVPIDAFGAALLRGMGWKEGNTVGKNQSGISEPIIHKPRPHLLGLGATPAPPVPTKSKKYIKPGEKREPDPFKAPKPVSSTDVPRTRRKSPEPARPKGIQVDQMVTIKEGRHRGKVGRVIDIKEKSSGLAAKIQLRDEDEVARVWLDEVEQFKGTSADEEDEDRNMSLKGWLRPRIRVRIISKSFKSGKYYNEKCIIQDIASMGECIVKLSNGDVLDGVMERHLETYIPSVGQIVMVVHHTDRTVLNHTGKLLERNHKTEKAIVQMDQTYDIVTLNYDQISEFL